MEITTAREKKIHHYPHHVGHNCNFTETAPRVHLFKEVGYRQIALLLDYNYDFSNFGISSRLKKKEKMTTYLIFLKQKKIIKFIAQDRYMFIEVNWMPGIMFINLLYEKYLLIYLL
ncbi:hypothetical protein ACJX0J_029288, partial [Zea mays]